jgi:UDPglucose 6-dehydrogenase
MNMTKQTSQVKIGFIGQGWIGKNYADDFESRGFSVTRYGLEAPYDANKDAIAGCDIVFIAVPTPTTEKGFDDSIVRRVLPLVGMGKIAVVKSTIIPGTTESLQAENPSIFVMHSPEFLVEKTAAYDAAHPNRNIVGIPVDNDTYRAKAQSVLDVLPDAPYARIMKSRDAEFVKYAGNCFLLTKVMFMNVLYDLVAATGGDWTSIRDSFIHDPRIGASHTEPMNAGGRGAGGDCFIKDFESFRKMYKDKVGDHYGEALLEALKDKNLDLLVNSGKDLKLVEGVYGNVSKYKTT